MHWLQSLDTALFHFVNSTLSNRFFDWLMPLLSGVGVPWLIAVVIAVPLAVIFGSTRLRLCALFMVLVVALGDPLVVGTIKDAVQRPRPFVVVKDAHLFGEIGKGYVQPLPDGSLPPGTNVHSFPSAHSANWFAIATIAFLFYRRSAWFMYPMAAAVAFSRVYNGVHYPGDVTAGAILGAGYAIAFAVLIQITWNFLGKRAFPAWHTKLPNLLSPQPSTINYQLSTKDEWLRLGYLIIALALIGRWIYIASGIINLSEDEAYQWLWSKHLALSYYSKPPGIAYIQWAGTHLFGDTNFGVRFFSPVLAAVMSILILRFMAREVGTRAAFSLLLITFATPLFVPGSILMTIDPPLVLCWMWAVVAGWRAAQPDSKTRDWLIVGAALGLGFLCKYTAAAQIVCWAIFFALQPSARVHLKKPGPWLALFVFVICTLPVIIWNAQRDWVTLIDLGGDAGLHGVWHPTLSYFWEFIGAEAGLLNPIFFVASLWACIATWKRRKEKPLWFFLLCMSAPLVIGYWLYSFHSRIQANWIAAAVPPMFCLMVAYWSESKIRFKPWLCAGIALGITVSVFMYSSDLIGRIAGNKLPGDTDPTHRVRGWRETARLVESEREKFDTNAFIIADHYGTTGLYSFYSAPARDAAKTSQPLVYCLISKSPIDQFPFWDIYNYREHRQGENALFVLRLEPYKLESGWVHKWLHHEPIDFREIPALPPAPKSITNDFESVTSLGVREIKLSGDRVFQRVELFGCYHLK